MRSDRGGLFQPPEDRASVLIVIRSSGRIISSRITRSDISLVIA